MCTQGQGIYKHVNPKEVFTGYFAYVSILKMCILGIYPHIYAQGVSTGYFPAHLS